MLKFLIIVLCVFFVLRTLSRMFVVSSFNAINKKMQDEIFRRQGSSSNQGKPEGHISIDPGGKRNPGGNSDEGDYVDYEEVK